MKKLYVYFFGIIILVVLFVSLATYSLLNPELTIEGDKEISLEVFSEYEESGYSAKFFDEDLTNQVKVYTNLNNNVVGTYFVKYKLNNSLSRKGVQVKRTINVVDTTKPTLELDGEKEITLKIGEEFIEPGYSAVDNYDGDLTDYVEVTSDINSEVAGTYTVMYNVSDNSGNTVSDMRSVTYLENTVDLSTNYYTTYVAPINITTTGSKAVVEVAASQVGNVGGYPFWRWYGFNSRVEWCAIFISWVAYQTGDLQKGIIPRFAGVPYGQRWFKSRGLYQYRGYTPKSGEIIFFDYDYNGIDDHVGIVEYVYDGKVYTIEGNSQDKCRRKSYSLNSKVIGGYGTPLYEEPVEETKEETVVEETKEEVITTPTEEATPTEETTPTEEVNNDITPQTSEN